jgi:hypothetical protein
MKPIKENDSNEKGYLDLAAYLEENGRYLEAINILKLGYYKSYSNFTICK